MKISIQDNSAWGVLWSSENRLDGKKQHLMYDDDCLPALFRTRKEAREWINAQYGYIRERIDLKAEPHGWRIPKAVRVSITPNAPHEAHGARRIE